MALAALCLAVAVPTASCFAQPQTQQYENGQLLRIFDAASVQFAKIGLSYSVGDLMQGYKAGTVTISDGANGDGFAVSVGGGITTVILDDIG